MQPEDKSQHEHTDLGFYKAERTVPAELVRAPRGETDPNGKGLNEPGAKADAGKVRPALVLGGFARALLSVSQIGTDGAKKYTDLGWATVPDGINRYEEAMLRHWLKEKSGEEYDADSGSLHSAHFLWNALARLELILREQEVNK